MKTFVLDANAILTFWEEREGSERVARIMDSAAAKDAKVLMSVINVGEVFYSVWKKHGEAEAKLRVQQLLGSPVDFVPAGFAEALHAAELKAKYHCGYADAFAAALALSKRATLVTADPDLWRFEDKLKILWLPSHKAVN